MTSEGLMTQQVELYDPQSFWTHELKTAALNSS